MTPPLDAQAPIEPKKLDQNQSGKSDGGLSGESVKRFDNSNSFGSDTATPHLPGLDLEDKQDLEGKEAGKQIYFGLNDNGTGDQADVFGHWKAMAGLDDTGPILDRALENVQPLEKKPASAPELVESKDGSRRFVKDQKAGYQVQDKSGKPLESIHGFDSSKEKIVDVVANSDQSFKLTLDDGRILRSRQDGSSIVYKLDLGITSESTIRR
ncbi:MAG: hypothetical protein K8F91_19475 [Candidatus Obscuribacterales bacterium]|nr:hypothetical protein [Candidatus Obscuribacterales bacterium]